MKITLGKNQMALLEDLPAHAKKTAQHKTLKEIDHNTVVDPRYVYVQNDAQLQHAVDAVSNARGVAIDLETRGKVWKKGPPVALNIYTPDTAFFIPNRMVHAVRNFSDAEIFNAFAEPFANPKITKVGQEFKFDIHFMREWWNIEIDGFVHDTKLAGILLDENVSHSLEDMCAMYLHAPTWKLPHDAAFETWPIKVAIQYGCHDAEWTYKLAQHQWEALERPKLHKVRSLMYDVEMPVNKIAIEMEAHGVAFDHEYNETVVLPTLHTNIANTKAAVSSMIGTDINLNAPEQVANALFNMLGLPRVNGNCVDAYVLNKLKNDGHKIAGDVLEHRQWETIDKMFGRKLEGTVHNGHIHFTLNTIGAETGRMSCSKPNLQQLPKRIGPLIRRAIVPSPGCVFVSMDYSQIEYRLLADRSGDETMIQGFIDGVDFHTAVMVEAFGVPSIEYYNEHENDDDMIRTRTYTKNVNFGILFGMGPTALGIRIKVSQDEAWQFIQRWYNTYKRVKPFKNKVANDAFQNGFVETILGRKRRLRQIRSADKGIVAAAEREGVSAVIQGSAADLLKLAMLKQDQTIKQNHWPFKVMLQIHDELLYEVPQAWLQHNHHALDTLKNDMEQIYPTLKVPLVVSQQILTRWGDKVQLDFDEDEEEVA